MVSKDEIFDAIVKITGNDENKEFTKTDVHNEAHGAYKTVDEILKQLVDEGVIRVKRSTKRSVYYVLAKKKEVKKEVTEIGDMTTIKTALREVFEEYFGKPKTFEDLDRAYEMMKNSLGYVRIDDLRRQLGMSLEQFMSKFSDYVLQNYELISGGSEGFIKGGTIYGIVRRKR
jgi:predicted transcriptional regulator